jgi:hypothetical protein
MSIINLNLSELNEDLKFLNQFNFDVDVDIFNEDLYNLLDSESDNEKKTTIIKFPKKRKVKNPNLNKLKSNLKQNLVCTEKKKSFNCDYCNKVFSGPSGLWYHHNKSNTECKIFFLNSVPK